MNNTLKDWLGAQPDSGREFAQEHLIEATAQAIWEQLDRRQMTKADVAKVLDKSKAYVTQILGGNRNMTLRTLSDIAFGLGLQVEIQFRERMDCPAWDFAESLQGAKALRSVLLSLGEEHHAANNWQPTTVIATQTVDRLAA